MSFIKNREDLTPTQNRFLDSLTTEQIVVLSLAYPALMNFANATMKAMALNDEQRDMLRQVMEELKS